MNGKGHGNTPKDAVKSSWRKAFGGLTALLAPKIKVGSLRCVEFSPPVAIPGQTRIRVQEQRVDDPFLLTDAHSTCNIEIPRDKTTRYRHAELNVTSGVSVYVR